MSNSALDRVMDEVDSLPNLIKVFQGGKVDRVMRVVPLESRVLDLDMGPDNEEWEQIKRLVYLKAPLELKGTEPVAVGTSKEWTLTPDRVPVVNLGEVKEAICESRKTRDAKTHAKMLEEQGKKKPGRPKKA